MTRATPRQSWAGIGPVTGLVASATLLAVAPVFMPAGYDWIAHTTSESAAQGIEAGWVARLGFTVFGVSVITLAVGPPPGWNRWARASHFAFGLFMTMAAAASSRPWFETTFDATEDAVHSFAATAMGFAFAAGIAAVSIGRLRHDLRIRIRDVIAVAASFMIPLGMAALPDVAGLLQRAMFSIAYVWYAAESVPDQDSRVNPAEV